MCLISWLVIVTANFTFLKTGEEVQIRGAWDFSLTAMVRVSPLHRELRVSYGPSHEPLMRSALCKHTTEGFPSHRGKQRSARGPVAHIGCTFAQGLGCVSELAVICNLNISFVREQFRKEENKLQARGPQQRCRGTVCTPRPRARVHTAHL